MVPTKERNHSGILLKYKGENLLFDCGEGIQRQFRIADEKITKITRIFLSHWHGDHVLGIPGLLQSLNSSKYEHEEIKLKIYGPKGTKEKIETLSKLFEGEQRIELNVEEITKEGKIMGTDEFEMYAYALDHTLPCFGFQWKEKSRRRINVTAAKKLGLKEGPELGKLQQGKTITLNGKKIKPEEATYLVEGKTIGYIPDTAACAACMKIAEDCNILICESTYHSDEEEKAELYKHMTARQAATIASQANVEKLILTHFSQRYKSVEELEKEAKDIFLNTVAAYDFMKVEV